MKRIGYLLITIGFLAGALVTVIDEQIVKWDYLFGTLVIGVAGIAVVRLGKHRDSRSEHKLAANLQDIETSLTRITGNMTRLNEEKQSINTYDMRHRIDELFSEALTTFVEARQSLAQAYGLQVYADVMSHFASGERYLNRVWSASADGYIDEVTSYLDKAQAQFIAARDKVRRLEK